MSNEKDTWLIAGLAAFDDAGDQVGNLQWRLQHGQMPGKPVKLFVILIGNKRPWGRRLQVATLVSIIRRAHPESRILLVGLLPRGGQTTSTFYDWPSRYAPAITTVNFGLESIANTNANVSFISCGETVLPKQQDRIDSAIMADGLHPNAVGMDRCSAESAYWKYHWGSMGCREEVFDAVIQLAS
eukprot:jgi/Botrbrau1/15850/Bobra.40_1s0034.1